MSGYKVGQKRWPGGKDEFGIFLTPSNETFKAFRISTYLDDGTSLASTLENIGFLDECLLMENGSVFEAGVTYYFHGRIMRLPSDQVFNIILRPYNLADVEDTTLTQYVKRIVVKKRKEDNANDWADIHFTFTPVVSCFNALTFQLSRSAAAGDLDPDTVRFPSIIYEELSVVGNFMTESDKYIKAGIQTHPGLELCINGEEINVGRSGIYEVRNGLITVNTFSVLTAGIEDDEAVPAEEYYYLPNCYLSSSDKDTFYGHGYIFNSTLGVQVQMTTKFDDNYGYFTEFKDMNTEEIKKAMTVQHYYLDTGNWENIYPVLLPESDKPTTAIEKLQYQLANRYWQFDFYKNLRDRYVEILDEYNSKYERGTDYYKSISKILTRDREQIIEEVRSKSAYITSDNPEVVNSIAISTVEEGDSITSVSRVDKIKTRYVDAFVLDYMYETE